LRGACQSEDSARGVEIALAALANPKLAIFPRSNTFVCGLELKKDYCLRRMVIQTVAKINREIATAPMVIGRVLA